MDEFIKLFNQAKYFDAHEHLEQLWLEADPSDKPYLQGLIQFAALLHLIQQDRWVGAKKVYQRACKNLEGAPEIFQGIKLAELYKTITNIVQNQADFNPSDVKIAY